jgi:arylsulfatase A
LATFADIAGTKIDPQNASDSVSFASILKNDQATPPRQSLIMQSAMEVFVVRDGPWKLCLGPGSGAKGIHGNRPLPEDAWKTALESFDGKPSREAFLKAPFVQLFNINEDPHEDHNLAEKHPTRVSKMVGMLQSDIKQGRSTPGPKLKNTKNVVIHQRLLDFVRAGMSK